MNVSAITMKNLIGIKPTEESSSGLTDSATTTTTPALFMLMLLQQCTNSMQAKTTATDSQGETLEPAISFFGEIAAAQTETSTATTVSTSENAVPVQKNVDAIIGMVDGESTNATLTSMATASEGIASLVRTIQNTNATLDSGGSTLFNTQSNIPSNSQSKTQAPATDGSVQTETAKIVAPNIAVATKTVATVLEMENIVTNTVSPSKKIKADSDSVPANVAEIVVKAPVDDTVLVTPLPVDAAVVTNSASINLMKPAKAQNSMSHEKSTKANSDENAVIAETVQAVVSETQATLASVQAVAQGDLNSQGKSSSQKSFAKTDDNNTTVVGTESSVIPTNWSETLKAQTEVQHTTTSALHSSASSVSTSKIHTDQTLSGIHATKTGEEVTAGLTKMPDALLDQVVNSVAVQVHDKSSQMRILLQPESLGEVFVKVKVDDGKVNAQIEVVNPTTKVVLESNLGQLRESLSARGVDMQHIEIVASNQTGLGTSDGRSETQGQKSKRGFYDDTEEVPEESLHDLGYNTMEFVI
jgi:flagellar hook-length control protein FliK